MIFGIADREADIVCNLPRALPEGRSRGVSQAITPAQGPKERLGVTS
jgi:hypothetical protein